MAQNLYNFNNNDFVRDIYTGISYKIIDNGYKHGMAKIKNLRDGSIETWNACNNCRFEKLKGQLELF